jgi:hypothetical protein
MRAFNRFTWERIIRFERVNIKIMITKYRVHYKGHPISEPMTLELAMKKIEKLRCLFLGVTLERVELDGC